MRTRRPPQNRLRHPEPGPAGRANRLPRPGHRRSPYRGQGPQARSCRCRLTTNEWYKAQQLGDTYWLYVIWDPLDSPDPTPLMVQNPAKHLDYAKKEVVAARYYDVPANAVEQAVRTISGRRRHEDR